MFSQSQLKEWLHYDLETGIFVWKVKRGKGLVGNVAGVINNGYRRIMIEGRHYKSSRLAWFYVKGEWPKHQVDHKNLNKLDDSWDNLREATASQNQINRPKLKCKNFFLPKGVVSRKNGTKFEAWGSRDSKKIYLGVFNTPEEASEVYKKFVTKLHGEFIYNE
jgi:hypothetical protein